MENVNGFDLDGFFRAVGAGILIISLTGLLFVVGVLYLLYSLGGGV